MFRRRLLVFVRYSPRDLSYRLRTRHNFCECLLSLSSFSHSPSLIFALSVSLLFKFAFFFLLTPEMPPTKLLPFSCCVFAVLVAIRAVVLVHFVVLCWTFCLCKYVSIAALTHANTRSHALSTRLNEANPPGQTARNLPYFPFTLVLQVDSSAENMNA